MFVESYSQSVINLFDELKGKRKLVDIVNLLEDLTEFYITKHDIPVQLLLNDLDMAIKDNMFKGLTTLEIKKIYKVINKFDNQYTKIPTVSPELSTADKIKKMIEGVSDGEDNREVDEFLILLRSRLKLRINQSICAINMTEEYSDEFNSYYIRLFQDNKEKEFAIIVVQNKLLLYYSILTRRQYPINLKKSVKGLDTLLNVFVEGDLEFIESDKT